MRIDYEGGTMEVAAGAVRKPLHVELSSVVSRIPLANARGSDVLILSQ